MYLCKKNHQNLDKGINEGIKIFLNLNIFLKFTTLLSCTLMRILFLELYK